MSLIRLLLALALPIFTHAWECGGARDDIGFIPPHKRKLLTRSTALEPIRLSYHYLNFTMGTPETEKHFREVLMPAVDYFFTSRLKVNSILDNIVLNMDSGKCGEVFIPNDHKTTGVPNADVVIYISSEISSTASYIAYAGACALEPVGKNNVLAGRVMINNYYFLESSFESQFSTMVHEITHLLGFSSGLYSVWRDGNGNKYTKPTQSINIRGANKTVLVTPNVAAKAKEFFKCDTMTGLELEDGGSSGTAGSHWDTRIMMNDFMVGRDTSNPVFSHISLALMKDTGWYDVDYTKADLPSFGAGIGCSFFDSKCVVSGKTAFPSIFCSEKISWDCDALALGKATCNLMIYSSALPTAYQYFTDPKMGGDDFADYCPTYMIYSNGNCRASNASETLTQAYSDEVVGMKSRCLKSTLNTKYLLNPYSACYEVVNCTNTSAIIKIGTKTAECPFTGGTITVPGYFGELTCPKSNVLCAPVPCKDGCSGAGKCVAGACQCDPGFAGETCLVRCNSTCSACDLKQCLTCKDPNAVPANATCICKTGYLPDQYGKCIPDPKYCGTLCNSCDNGNCSVCKDNTELINGQCSCFFGFFEKAGVCTPCHSTCKECSNNNTCLKCMDVNAQPFNESCICSPGFVLDKVGKCNLDCGPLCLDCVSGSCENCKTNSTFSQGKCECNQGYYQSNSSCFACKPSCASCNMTHCLQCLDPNSIPSSSGCTCKAGFISNGNGGCMTPCEPLCKSCNNGLCTNCTINADFIQNKCTCLDGLFENKTSCSPCPKSCSTCNGSLCLTCNDPNSVPYGFSCVCKPGYALSTAGVCEVTKVCEPLCVNCTEGLCSGCKIGSKLVNGFCECDAGTKKVNGTCMSCGFACSLCDQSKCLNCSSGSSLNSNGCSCLPGFAPVSNGCQPCSNNCKQCSSPTSCQFCVDGFFLVDGYCKQCSPGCLSCSSAGCKTCKAGYYLENGVCNLNCTANCKTCYNGICNQCVDTYYLNSSGNCSSCIPNCRICKDSSVCGECLPNFILTPNSQCGLKCSTNCSSCDYSTGKCNQCVTGFFLTSTQTCAPCSSNCDTCQSNTKCTLCTTGFELTSNYICKVPCPLNCKICKDKETCSECETKYQLTSAGTCSIKCPLNCTECDNIGKCTKCNNGFYVKSGLCSKCLAGCVECTSGASTGCTKCGPKYYIKSGKCLACSANCLSCSTSGCSECDTGYLLKSGKCEKKK